MQENSEVVSPCTKIRGTVPLYRRPMAQGKGDWREARPSFGETLQDLCALRLKFQILESA